MKTAALFGGSFDPPHIGHMQIVKRLKELSYIDKIVIMPTYLNPHKQRFHAPAELRYRWLKRIFQNDQKVEVSDFEVKQRRKVPTFETVQRLLQRFDEVYVVIGADNVETLHKWHNIDQLKKLAKFIVVKRPGYEIKKLPHTVVELQMKISSSALREKMDKSSLPAPVANEIYKFYKEHNENENRQYNEHFRQT